MTFATYVLSGDDHVLTVEKAFVCLTLFDIIKMPLAMLPLVIVYMAEVNITYDIIHNLILTNFLLLPNSFFSGTHELHRLHNFHEISFYILILLVDASQ